MRSTIYLLLCVCGLAATSLSAERHYDDYESDRYYDSDGYFNYVRMGGGVIALSRGSEGAPVIAIGRRYESGDGAIDISFNYAPAEEGSYYYAAPRALYLHYLEPQENKSVYFGGGVSWGGVKIDHRNSHFHGVIGEAVVGYELQRWSDIRAFFEATLSQPLFALSKRGKHAIPTVMFTIGFGF